MIRTLARAAAPVVLVAAFLTAQPAGAATVEPRTYGAALRHPPGGHWELVTTPGHTPVGLSRATCDPRSGALTVTYTEPIGSIVTAFVTPDETFARRGYSGGASVGLSSMRVYFGTADGRSLSCADSRLASASGNWWVGLFALGG